MPSLLKISLWGLLLLGMHHLALADPASANRLGGPLSFAERSEAMQLLSADDEWFERIGPVQLSALHPAPQGVPKQEIGRLFQQIAQECTNDQKQRWTEAFSAAWAKIAPLQLNWPERMVLICTNGQDAPESPYTRKNFVVLPESLHQDGYSDLEIAAHELFHIYSRHNPKRQDALYALFNFKPAPEFAWPQEWDLLRVSNPDAPRNKHVISLSLDGQRLNVMPILVASRLPQHGQDNLFEVIDLRLVPVSSNTKRPGSHALRQDGQLRWVDAGVNTAYWEATGRNTQYLLHPEEIAADNFAFLISGRKVANPALLEKLSAFLQQRK